MSDASPPRNDAYSDASQQSSPLVMTLNDASDAFPDLAALYAGVHVTANQQSRDASQPFRDPHWADRYAAATTDDERLTIAWSYYRATMKRTTASAERKDAIRRELTTFIANAIDAAWRAR